MKDLEISISGRVSYAPQDPDDVDTDKILEDVTQEFEKTPIGKGLLKEGYSQVDYDFDDDDGETMEISITYRKE